jgi:hypothetical protein
MHNPKGELRKEVANTAQRAQHKLLVWLYGSSNLPPLQMSEADCCASSHGYAHGNQQSARANSPGKTQTNAYRNHDGGCAVKENPKSSIL